MAFSQANFKAVPSHDSVPNHDSQIIAIVACFTILSLIALGLRLVSRRINRISFNYDDYLAIVSWVHMFTNQVSRIRLTQIQILTLGEGAMIASGKCERSN